MNGQENTQQYPINKECDSVMLVTWQTLGYKLHSNGSMANKKTSPNPRLSQRILQRTQCMTPFIKNRENPPTKIKEKTC